MTLIKVKSKDVYPLPTLWRKVVQHCYDRESVAAWEVDMIQQSILNWTDHLSYMKDSGQMNSLTIEQAYQLKIIIQHWMDDNEGRLSYKQKTYREHKIDYRKAYGFPEAYDIAGLVKAQEEQEKLKRINPEENE